MMKKQAGTGPSRRHIQGSKIAKGHQSFKVFSSTALKNFFEKSLTTPKKIERGTLWDFSIPSLSQNPKKLKGGTFFFRKKSLAMPKKTERGDTVASSGIVCYAGNFLVLFPGPTGEI